jgi:glycosyltransferase involved in cell wall biosynthesis
MHIVQIVPELNEGGVERGVLEMNRELVRRGVESTVISRGGRLAPAVETDGGQYVALDVCSKNPFTFPARVRSLRRALTEIGPDIVHVRSRLPAWMLRFANEPGWPVVTTVHGFNSVSPYSRIMTRADRVICVSHAIRAYIQQHYRTPDDKLRVIHRGLDATTFNPERLDFAFIDRFRKEHGLNGRFVVTSVGRIAPLKDYETFIRAVADARRSVPEIVGLIVGSARPDRRAYENRLRALVAELAVTDAVRFVGSHRQIAEIDHLSDVVVSCSAKPESFGRSLIEALAMETPVIATRHGGAVEIVREGIDGYLFAPGDVAGLAEAIRNVRERTFVNLRAGAYTRFAMEKMVESTLAVYREVLAARA